MRGRTAALTSVAALLAAACSLAAGVDTTAMLHPTPAHSTGDQPAAISLAALGARHPVVGAVAPAQLLSTAARHLPVTASGPRCDATQPRGAAAKYDGRSASALYDRLFTPDAPMPYLKTHVPKALRTWYDWNGRGEDLILLGTYRLDHPSYLVGLDPRTGRVVGTVVIKESHLAGMDFLRDWLFTQDDAPRGPINHHPMVRRYRVAALRAAMQRSAASGQKVHLAADGPADPIAGIDFFTVEGDSAYAGNHGNPPVPGLMYRYALTAGGHLRKVQGPWSIPLRAQGLLITPDDFVFSTNNDVGRGSLIVVRRAAPAQTKAPIGCIWMPAMPENMTVHDGRLLVSFESGSPRLVADHPVNHITHLHSASLEELMATLDPVARKVERVLGVPLVEPRPADPLSSLLSPTTPPPRIPVPTIPVLPVDPLTPDLPGPVAPAPVAVAPPDVQAPTPPQRVSDAFDLYTSRTDLPSPAPGSAPTVAAVPPGRAPGTSP